MSSYFAYSEEYLLKGSVGWQSQKEFAEDGSSFDLRLKEKWTKAMDEGHFRYILNITHSKVLPGKYGFFAQLNVDRATNRRTPHEITSMAQLFDPSKFNFTKVKEAEVIFNISRNGKPTSESLDVLIINVSPLEFSHSLLLPKLSECLPQLATVDSICLALQVLLLSSSPSFRVGFNSLCGYASVNHLHYHVYYLNQQMLLEHIEVKHLSGPCYELIDYPAVGFAFQLDDSFDTQKLAIQIHELTDLFQNMKVAHNIYMTRGTRFCQVEKSDHIVYNTVRVYVWARASSSGAKESAAFNPALCELFGHLNVKESTLYDKLDEDEVSAILSKVCWDTFHRVREHVKALYDRTKD